MVTAQLLLAFVGISALLYVGAFLLAEVRSLLRRNDDEAADSSAVPAVLTPTLTWVPGGSTGGQAEPDGGSDPVTWDGTWGGPGRWVDGGAWR